MFSLNFYRSVEIPQRTPKKVKYPKEERNTPKKSENTGKVHLVTNQTATCLLTTPETPSDLKGNKGASFMTIAELGTRKRETQLSHHILR